MKLEDIKLNDWGRMFLGPVPPSFYFELVIRAFVIYLLVLFSMRLLGKRMTAHISQLELVALVSIASAIGIPLLTPDNGLLPAFLIASIVVAITRVISKIAYKNKHFEKAAQGKADILLEDAVLNYNVMREARISRERLFAQLRSVKVNHLGCVQRVQLEVNGAFTIVKSKHPKAGLMILPAQDTDFISRQVMQTDIDICKKCGAEKEEIINNKSRCPNCDYNEWTKAVIDITTE